MEPVVIFGAGRRGRKALSKYGKDNVLYIVDNNREMQGRVIDGVVVKNIDFYRTDKRKPHIIIACAHSANIIKQLASFGINDYDIYGNNAYFDTDKLVYNPYVDNYKQDDAEKIEELNQEVKQLYKNLKMFNHIEIETINRCNGVCDFCPVNVNKDKRKFSLMEENLFYKIISELEDLEYSGKLALFSNNEPFLDKRIIEFHRYARMHLPNARMHLCTNGTKLSLDEFIEIMKYLDELIIDNYNQQLKVISPVKKIVEYCNEHSELKNKVTVVLRKPYEVLTSRGGDAPNVHKMEKYPEASCMLPFKQIIVRPSGMISLCCNDALGKVTLGDLNKDNIKDIWFGEKFKEIRGKLLLGRKNIERCRYCDTVFFC